MSGTPRPVVEALPSYKPGKAAASAAEEHGLAQAVKLSSNETPWPPLPAVQEAIIAAATGANRYADVRGTPVREKLADWLGVNVERVTVGSGSVGLLHQLALTYLDPGDEVVFPWRSFEVYPVFGQLVDAKVIMTPLVDHKFDLDEVAAAVHDQTKLVFLSNPNNPSGTAHDTDALGLLLSQIPSSVVVVIDEAYHEFMNPALGDPITDLADDYDNLMVLRTFSKAQGMASLRFGYGVSSPEVVAAVDKTLVPFAVNGVSQAAAIACIDHMDEITERVDIIKAERDRVSGILRDSGYEVPPSEANFVYLSLGDDTDQVALGLEQRGIVGRPFSGEGIRVTISTSEENGRFLSALAETRA